MRLDRMPATLRAPGRGRVEQVDAPDAEETLRNTLAAAEALMDAWPADAALPENWQEWRNAFDAAHLQLGESTPRSTSGGPPNPWPEEVKELAYQLDPECWISYRGKPRDFKRSMEVRRKASLERAREELPSEYQGRDLSP